MLAAFLVNGAIAKEEGQSTNVDVWATAAPVKEKPIKLPNIKAETRTLLRASRHTAQQQYKKSSQVVRFWENKGRWIRAPRKEKCWQVPWQRSCRLARASYKLHLTLMTTAKRKLDRELPETNDWRTAVRIAQRAYPGTESWLLSCSATEGSWGKWVPNREGSGVGGWMQMYPSTFSTMMHGYYLPRAGRWFPGAWKDLQQRGFIVPKSADSWYSPLGQALASAYGMLNGRKGEWHGSGC